MRSLFCHVLGSMKILIITLLYTPISARRARDANPFLPRRLRGAAFCRVLTRNPRAKCVKQQGKTHCTDSTIQCPCDELGNESTTPNPEITSTYPHPDTTHYGVTTSTPVPETLAPAMSAEVDINSLTSTPTPILGEVDDSTHLHLEIRSFDPPPSSPEVSFSWLSELVRPDITWDILDETDKESTGSENDRIIDFYYGEPAHEEGSLDDISSASD